MATVPGGWFDSPRQRNPGRVLRHDPSERRTEGDAAAARGAAQQQILGGVPDAVPFHAAVQVTVVLRHHPSERRPEGDAVPFHAAVQFPEGEVGEKVLVYKKIESQPRPAPPSYETV
ncbi:Uncharacterized protein OBRU01_03604 [Operophtera brumata]|uniref:Uncharacterized protein n=1 Tax=Operophtera brumata TaxID=104452 RepID=A0A0L7LQK7_OPEBR|nr:Uncharacterized protein OBRU01_03604 [Operophtera brumata]